MIERLLLQPLTTLLSQHAAVGLLGPRQVGKTTLALAVAATRPAVYLDLETPSQLAKLAEPELYLATQEDRLVILDEIQRLPGLFQTLRGLIDRGRQRGQRTGRFLVLGSASLELLQQSAESLAGRIVYVELTPFHLLEIGHDHPFGQKNLDYASQAPLHPGYTGFGPNDDHGLEIGGSPGASDRLWLRGGFPDSFLAESESASLEWRRAFIRTYLERDIPQLGPRLPAETLRRLWTMLAHLQGEPLNAARLATGLGVSGQTVGRYLDLLVDLLLVRRLSPWAANIGKRLVRSSKIYVRDSGLVHALLGISDLDTLLGHPVVGSSWEGFAIEMLITVAPRGTEAYYYRTAAGAEIDLLLVLPDKQVWAIEIKRSLAPKPAKGFHQACADLNPAARYVVFPGAERFPLSPQIEAIGLCELAAILHAL